MTPTHIILHHSLTKDSGTVSWGAIKRYHMRVKGWRDIGYHMGIELIGDYHQVLLGRTPDMQGAHCTQKHMNRKSIGICFVGNFDLYPPSTSMWKSGLDLVRWLKNIYNIPLENIKGHRDYASYKTCPGLFFDINKFKKELES